MSLIIRSNLNALLEKAECPEKMLDQIIADMMEHLREIKLQIAHSLKDEVMLARKAEESAKLCLEYEKKAMLCLEKDDEALAREALARKKSYGNIAESMSKEHEEQKKAVELLKSSFKALELKIDEAKQRKQILLSRQKRAETKMDMTDAVTTANSAADLFDAFERMADKVSATEAIAGAFVDLEQSVVEEKFNQMERTAAMDDELAQLKAKMKK